MPVILAGALAAFSGGLVLRAAPDSGWALLALLAGTFLVALGFTLHWAGGALRARRPSVAEWALHVVIAYPVALLGVTAALFLLGLLTTA